MELSIEQQKITDSYYKDNAKKLYSLVDKVLLKLHFIDIDKNDFYSLATDIFIESLVGYDNSQSFEGFLYSCLYKKFCTDMTGKTRAKRCTKIKVKRLDENGNIIIETVIIPDVRIDAPISDAENSTYGDLIADQNNVENQIFGKEDKEEWHDEVKEYLKCLSPLQRKIALMIADEYTPDQICADLHITMNHYINSTKKIFADEKIKILRPLVERKGVKK